MRGMMASLGIVKGKPFAPDERMKGILSAGAEVGMNMAHALRYGDKLPNTLYYDDRQWHNVLNVLDVAFKQNSYLDIDARIVHIQDRLFDQPGDGIESCRKGVQVSLRVP
jgi:hypothetical protein